MVFPEPYPQGDSGQVDNNANCYLQVPNLHNGLWSVICRKMTIVSQDYVLNSVMWVNQKFTVTEIHTETHG